MTVAGLRALPAEEQPDVRRHPAPWIPHTARKRQEMTMSQPIPPPRDPRAAAPALRPVPAADQPSTAHWTVGKLLSWADAHDSKAVRNHAVKARTHIDALRTQLQADSEASALDSEMAKLEKQLAELRAQKAKLRPGKVRAQHSYSAATVRAWATEQGITVPAAGRVPRTIVDQWRAAQQAGA